MPWDCRNLSWRGFFDNVRRDCLRICCQLAYVCRVGKRHESKRMWRMINSYRTPAALIVTFIALLGCTAEVPAKRHQGQPDELAEPATHAVRRHGARATPPNLGFDYTSENARLQGLGIPTPVTSARFRTMPDAMLESMAEGGDKMAKTFWVERLADEALTLQQSRNADGTFPEGIEEKDAVGGIGQMAYHLNALAQDPRNAMAGYLWGQYIAASTYGGAYEPIVAGIRLAGLRGDDRAIEFEREFRNTHPGLDEGDIEMYFESGKRQMESAAKPRGP